MFSNFIIPVVALKSRTMLTDIVYAQPAFDLKEGVFFDRLNGFAMKVGKKEENDSVIRDVVVYETQLDGLQDNFIIAKSGVMRVSENKRYLEFNLKDGWRYQERANRNGGAETDYLRLGFKEYKKQFDMSDLQINWTPDSTNKNNEKFFSIRQLNRAIDSLKGVVRVAKGQLNTSVYNYLSFGKYIDSTKNHDSTGLRGVKDSIFQAAKSMDALLPDSARVSVSQQAVSQAGSMKESIKVSEDNLEEKERILRKHKIEWHRKFVLSLSCLVLFMIGAPLGSIIRKGGLGTPLIAAISFFMVFYFSTTVGEKFAKEGSWPPLAGVWLAIFILVPIGIFLTYKAMRDSQLFNKESYHRIAKNVRQMVRKFSTGRKQNDNSETAA